MINEDGQIGRAWFTRATHYVASFCRGMSDGGETATIVTSRRHLPFAA